MTLATTTARVTYAGNGSTTVFPFAFIIPASGDEEVIYTNASGVQTTISSNLYSVSGFGNPNGGTITYPLSGSPIASGTTITIIRVVPYVQGTSLQNQGAYLPSATEGALDYEMMAIQQLADGLSRAITVPLGDPSLSPLPNASARKNSYLVFDSSGNPTVLTGGPGSVVTPPVFTGDSGLGGSSGVVPAPPAGSYQAGKFLSAGGSFISPTGRIGISTPQDFGAVPDGVTDCTAAIQAAIDALPASGGCVFFPVGTYMVTGIHIDGTSHNKTNVHLYGAGFATILRLKAATSANVIAADSGSGFQIKDMTVDGNKAAQTATGNFRLQNGIRLSGVTGAMVDGCNLTGAFYAGICVGAGDLSDNGSSRVIVSNCIMQYNTDGTSGMYQTDCAYDSCLFISNTAYGALIDQFSTQCAVSGCVAAGNGSHGIYLYRNNGSTVSGCVARSNGAVGILLDNASTFCTVAGSYVGQNSNAGIALTGGCYACSVTGCTSESNTQDGIIFSSSGTNTVSGCAAYNNSFSGINFTSSPSSAASNNISFLNRGSGIYVTGCAAGSITGNLCTDNNKAAGSDSGIRLINSTNIAVSGNRCTDDQGSKTQTYGVALEGTSAACTVIGNDVSANLTAGMSITGSHIIRHNNGFLTESSGTATITAATNSVVVTHGLNYTPASADISVTRSSAPGSDVSFWVDTITSTTFTLHVNANPTSGSVFFNWQVRRT